MNGNMTNINDLFSRNLKKFRSMKYKTQKEFADVLNLPPTTYGQYENGKRQPEFNTLVQMAKLLDISVDMLLTNSEYDAYLEYVCKIFNTYALSSEKSETMPDKKTICNIYSANGKIKLTHTWYEKMLEKLEDKIHNFIREEVREEIVSQRLELNNRAVSTQYALEAKVLCEILHYDYEIVVEVADRINWEYMPEEKILDIIYRMYFMSLKGTEDADEIVDEILTLIEARKRANELLEERGILAKKNTNEWPYNYLKIVDERKIKRNHIVELYLLKHWGTEDVDLDKFNDPHKAIRAVFYGFGLMQNNELKCLTDIY